MYRSDTYDLHFSRRMRNPKFAQEYLLSLIEDSHESMTVEEALRFVIRRMGTSDFAEMAKETIQSVDKFLKGERHPKPETLDRYLRPFKLKTKVGVIKLKAA